MSDLLPGPCFESERLAMRPQTIADAEALHEAYADADLMTWWSSAPHRSIEETRDYLAARDMPTSWRGWTMVACDTGAVVGTLAAHPTRAGVVEIGYLVLRRHWGRGYAREGVTRLIDLLFAAGNRRVMADIDPDNVVSRKLAETLGFRLEGVLREEWHTHIGVRDSCIYGLLAREWFSS